jgi:acetaldehyde dehydrogenase (acetylating)
VGVVAAVIPTTNPTSTAIYKTLISIKAQNAIVLSPHPAAIECICQTATLLDRAALAAGAPEGLIDCMQHTTLEGTRELMRQHAVGVILATGGTGLVRVAYSSGKPAYGVGPGNVPAFIERTADVRKAVADIIAGTTFDYGTICSSEQAIVAEEPVRELALDECRRQGAYFLSPEETEKLGRLVIQPGSHVANPKIVGRPATAIAEMAGIKVPPTTRVLIARLEPDQVGREFPLSAEKLSPILAFYAAPNLAAGIALCRRLLEFGGLGHTCSVHSQNRPAILEFGKSMPAFRVVVNSSSVHGSIGYSTNLFPAMTLGCGAPGGNITSDNIGPQHLMNVKRIAWESRAVEHRTIRADHRMAGASISAAPEAVQGKANMPIESVAAKSAAGPLPSAKLGESRAVESSVPISAARMEQPPGRTPPDRTVIDRATVARVVQQVLASQGIAQGSGAPTPEPAARKLPSPSSIASEIVGRVFGSPSKPHAEVSTNSSASVASAAKTEGPVAPISLPRAAQEPEPPAKPPVEIVPFVSENDVRRAMTRSEKIFVGPKTILTPSARDLGLEHDVFIQTEAGSIR